MYYQNLLLVILTFILYDNTVNIYAYRTFDVDGVETILALENETINIECKTDGPLSYCGLINPTGERCSFKGQELHLGSCFNKVNVTKQDIGEWTCHLGKSAIGVETTKKIMVRIVNRVAAIKQNVTAVHGREITLECVTTEGLRSLVYCRFEPPNRIAFNINSAVNFSNAILEKYYYPPTRSMDRGDCAVTIRNVQYEDIGSWTCGAGLDDGKEYIDVIMLKVEGSKFVLIYGVTIFTVAFCLIGVVAWKHRIFSEFLPSLEEIEIADMDARQRLRATQSSPQPSPQPERNDPEVVVQSPSESSSSPVTATQ
ncbi:uncharacterized protein LOC128199949 isoform X2 [Galleria mellonella]|uniref:Uncharacterized protein LOC128199949 isoform X2 n=1 Tax=Galleria mellonella TaxID=7137 RepID=A0A6J3BUT1_GALME|nr:uncharacterized protein LOC128199949 isoform X2 [Galleria mellonella]